MSDEWEAMVFQTVTDKGSIRFEESVDGEYLHKVRPFETPERSPKNSERDW